MVMMQPLIQLDNISFAYHSKRPLLTQISFSLGAGERVALMGANGSGKSTLLKMLVGLCHPTAGEITILGQRRRTEADFVKIRGGGVGFLFQDAEDQLFCPTVAEDVAFGPLNQGKSWNEVQTIVTDTLTLLGLTGYEKRITYQLSGGEKRLVAIATVLAMQPAVLLLDEPTTGLDENFQQRVTDVLLQLPQAMLIVSHDRDFLEKVTQRKMVLRQGSIFKMENGFNGKWKMENGFNGK
jgi:cobalt/nickel transport system ATP-binding protein